MHSHLPTSHPVDVPLTEILLRRAQAGDARAFSELFDRYRDRILRIAYLRMKPELARRVDPEDIAQMTLAVAWPRLHTFDPRQAPRFIDWLAVITQNCILDAWKRETAGIRDMRKEQPMAPSSTAGASSCSIPLPALQGTPSQHASASEQAEIYDRCLRRLPNHYREVILLHEYAEMSWEEIAIRMARPSADAASELYRRARKALDPELEREGFDISNR